MVKKSIIHGRSDLDVLRDLDLALFIIPEGFSDLEDEIRELSQTIKLSVAIVAEGYEIKPGTVNAYTTALRDELADTAQYLLRPLLEAGHLNLDFNDYFDTLYHAGRFVIARGTGRGEGRMDRAVKEMETQIPNHIPAARMLLLLQYYRYITPPLHVSEIMPVNHFCSEIASEVDIKFGIYWNDTLPTDGVEIIAIIGSTCEEK